MKKSLKLLSLLLATVLCLSLCACQNSEPKATPEPTMTPEEKTEYYGSLKADKIETIGEDALCTLETTAGTMTVLICQNGFGIKLSDRKVEMYETETELYVHGIYYTNDAIEDKWLKCAKPEGFNMKEQNAFGDVSNVMDSGKLASSVYKETVTDGDWTLDKVALTLELSTETEEGAEIVPEKTTQEYEAYFTQAQKLIKLKGKTDGGLLGDISVTIEFGTFESDYKKEAVEDTAENVQSVATEAMMQIFSAFIG